MTNVDSDWISHWIDDARSTHPLVTETAYSRLKNMLAKQFTERQLTSKDLNMAAKTLVSDMTPAESGEDEVTP